MNRKWIRRILIVVLLVVAVWALRMTVFRPEPIPVTVFRVASGLVEETVTNSKAGTVEARQRASISPEVGGRVAGLPVREGDRIRKGQVLMKIADADYRARLEASARGLEVAEASRDEACTAAEQGTWRGTSASPAKR
jgi:HlyD family secretion protein